MTWLLRVRHTASDNQPSLPIWENRLRLRSALTASPTFRVLSIRPGRPPGSQPKPATVCAVPWSEPKVSRATPESAIYLGNVALGPDRAAAEDAPLGFPPATHYQKPALFSQPGQRLRTAGFHAGKHEHAIRPRQVGPSAAVGSHHSARPVLHLDSRSLPGPPIQGFQDREALSGPR